MREFANHLILDFEKDSDQRVSSICRALIVLDAAVMLLNLLQVFKISPAVYPTLIVSSIILLVPTFLWRAKRIEHW